MPHEELVLSHHFDGPFRDRLEKTARLLDDGKQAEAVILASMTDWKDLEKTSHTWCMDKANFNLSEPRVKGGGGPTKVIIRNRPGRLFQLPQQTIREATRWPANAAANAAGLNRERRRMLHDLITREH